MGQAANEVENVITAKVDEDFARAGTDPSLASAVPPLSVLVPCPAIPPTTRREGSTMTMSTIWTPSVPSSRTQRSNPSSRSGPAIRRRRSDDD